MNFNILLDALLRCTKIWH